MQPWPCFISALRGHGLALARVLALALPLSASGAGASASSPELAPPRCLSECLPRIGIVSAFGAEADLLLARLQQPQHWNLPGGRYTTGELAGHRVVIVLSGVSMVNAAMVTQELLDHFQIDRLIMSGIAGGVNPAHHVGDVIVPDRWAQPLEVYWHSNNHLPSPCGGAAGDMSCLGLRLATPEGQPLPPLSLHAEEPGAKAVPTGLFVRATQVRQSAATSATPAHDFQFDFPVDPAMLAVAHTLKPALLRCGPTAPTGELPRCVSTTPVLVMGGRGASAPVFLAHPQVRRYLHEVLQIESFDMETAALAQVARVHQVPYIAFRSLSDLAGAETFNADVAALFSSGLAETNETAVTLAFLQAWPGAATRAAALPVSASPPR
jgi:adenosylhomocysteine nucleosidase